MSTDSSARNILLSAAIFIAMEIAALAILSKSSSLANIWITRASHRTMAAVWGGFENVRNIFNLSEQNEVLLEQNIRLTEELQKYKAAEEAATEVSSSAEAKSSTFRYIPATIVKISTNTAHNHIILNKGSEDGVKPDCGIISADGVIGIIKAVGRHYSYGLTLMNANVSIGGRIKGKGYLAPVVWDGRSTNGAYMKDMPLHHVVAPGDTIVTSGFSTIFPPDVPVGVAGESTMVDGSVYNITVTLFQDFSRLKYVSIVENLEKADIQALEAGEEDR